MNEETVIKTKQYCSNIEVSSITVIAFGLWTILKHLFILVFQTQKILEVTELSPEEFEDLKVTMIIILFIILGLILFIHTRIGFGAIKYAREQSSKKTFLFWAIILECLTFASLFSYTYIFYDNSVDDSEVASFMLDFSLFICLLDLITSAIKLSKIRKDTRTG